MNPVALALQRIQAAQAQRGSGRTTVDVYLPKDQFQEHKLPEQKFEHFDVHPVMRDFFKTKDDK